MGVFLMRRSQEVSWAIREPPPTGILISIEDTNSNKLKERSIRAIVATGALLTLVASLLVGHHVPVYCHHPIGIRWEGRVAGFAFYNPAEIYLRYCPCTRRLRPFCILVFAHELIHVEHPHWPHKKVYKWDDWYGRVVVAPTIRRLE